MVYLSGGATIKEKISTPLVSRPLSNILPEHVLMSHRAHCFIIDVQPNFPCVTVSVLMKNIDRIVPAIRRLAVMVEHPTKRVIRRFRRLSGSGYHDV
jgi:hypothetical protein